MKSNYKPLIFGFHVSFRWCIILYVQVVITRRLLDSSRSSSCLPDIRFCTCADAGVVQDDVDTVRFVTWHRRGSICKSRIRLMWICCVYSISSKCIPWYVYIYCLLLYKGETGEAYTRIYIYTCVYINIYIYIASHLISSHFQKTFFPPKIGASKQC